ncbi:hypothetical protein GOODEAATRI_002860 [Goodea atripinnis]|uniref:Secreted protein n=1 Tax=Goodea atripinnis TaxID=208336 RepID=A0ABV0P118_9TELE
MIPTSKAALPSLLSVLSLFSTCTDNISAPQHSMMSEPMHRLVTVFQQPRTDTNANIITRCYHSNPRLPIRSNLVSFALMLTEPYSWSLPLNCFPLLETKSVAVLRNALKKKKKAFYKFVLAAFPSYFLP